MFEKELNVTLSFLDFLSLDIIIYFYEEGNDALIEYLCVVVAVGHIFSEGTFITMEFNLIKLFLLL